MHNTQYVIQYNTIHNTRNRSSRSARAENFGTPTTATTRTTASSADRCAWGRPWWRSWNASCAPAKSIRSTTRSGKNHPTPAGGSWKSRSGTNTYVSIVPRSPAWPTFWIRPIPAAWRYCIISRRISSVSSWVSSIYISRSNQFLSNWLLGSLVTYLLTYLLSWLFGRRVIKT